MWESDWEDRTNGIMGTNKVSGKSQVEKADVGEGANKYMRWVGLGARLQYIIIIFTHLTRKFH